MDSQRIEHGRQIVRRQRGSVKVCRRAQSCSARGDSVVLRIGLRLKQWTIHRVRKSCAPVIYQQQIVMVHQWAKQPNVTVARFRAWISRTTFQGNDGFKLLRR